VANLSPPDAPTTHLVPTDYHVSPGDSLDIVVFRQAALSGTFQISQAGTITLPLLGDVTVNGLTTTDIGVMITKKYSERYLQDPQVSVAIKDAASQHFTVDGAVTNPGVYTMIGNMTLLQALDTAHGGADVADNKRVVIFRVVNGQKVAGVFNVLKIRTGAAPDPRIYANDTIVVPVDNGAQTLKNLVGVTPLAIVASVFHF
jgi:polysaccharide export outer membrane protein